MVNQTGTPVLEGGGGLINQTKMLGGGGGDPILVLVLWQCRGSLLFRMFQLMVLNGAWYQAPGTQYLVPRTV